MFQYLAVIRALLARAAIAVAVALAALAVSAAPSQAQIERIGLSSGEPLPRFASLKAEEVNFRRGPGMSYAILWILRRRHLPVKVIGEYDHWRRIELHDGQRGWVHRALLSTRRFASPRREAADLYDTPLTSARLLAEIGETAPMRLKRCDKEWCEVELSVADNGLRRILTGWTRRDDLWGVGESEPGESFD